MKKQVIDVELNKLRLAYVTVKNFLETETEESIPSLKTKLAADLSLLGDDNYELLEKFVEEFELDHEGFQYDKHFYLEGELFGTEAALYNLLRIPIWLPLKIIELLTLNKIKMPNLEFYKPNREVVDMTFKDMLTWYLVGNYVTSSDVKFNLRSK